MLSGIECEYGRSRNARDIRSRQSFAVGRALARPTQEDRSACLRASMCTCWRNEIIRRQPDPARHDAAIDANPMNSAGRRLLHWPGRRLNDWPRGIPQSFARVFRRLRYLTCYMRALVQEIAVHPEVFWQEPERTILRGKIRRAFICCVPGLALYFKRRHRVTGGCIMRHQLQPPAEMPALGRKFAALYYLR